MPQFRVYIPTDCQVDGGHRWFEKAYGVTTSEAVADKCESWGWTVEENDSDNKDDVYRFGQWLSNNNTTENLAYSMDRREELMRQIRMAALTNGNDA